MGSWPGTGPDVTVIFTFTSWDISPNLEIVYVKSPVCETNYNKYAEHSCQTAQSYSGNNKNVLFNHLYKKLETNFLN